jgi:hypothetical protein
VANQRVMAAPEREDTLRSCHDRVEPKTARGSSFRECRHFYFMWNLPSFKYWHLMKYNKEETLWGPP